MFGSKSNFFYQDDDTLTLARVKLEVVLKNIWQRDNATIKLYLEAFDYMCKNPAHYDGATIVQDLCIIPKLDVFAMLHDYLYINYNAAANVLYKLMADWIYAREMQRMGVHTFTAWSRYAGLATVGLLFTPYVYLKGRRIHKKDKKTMLITYSNLL